MFVKQRIILVLLFLINWELSDAALIDKLNFKDNSDSDHSSINSEPLFIQNWKQLHREPPIKTIRAERRRNSVITEHTLRQKLDNFNDSRTDYWEMRYLENRKYFEEGGPLLIYVGGEWTISPERLQDGLIVDIAQEYNGMLFYTEHRFYGESKPTKNLAIENMEYLHVTQALADLAEFIRYQRREHPEYANSKVILFGCSYSASMVVWFKRLYPDLIDGAWGSSGPLFAKLDFVEYKQVVGKAIQELGSRKCYDRIERGFTELEEMVENGRMAELKALFKICNNFDENSDLDIWSFFDGLSEMFAAIVQYQNNQDIPRLCEFLMRFDDDVEALGHFWFTYRTRNTPCTDVSYFSSIQSLRDTEYSAMRAWLYQTCNEYGWYQTSSSPDHPFGRNFPVTLYTTMCADLYGKRFTRSYMEDQIAQTNAKFGGYKPDVSNVHVSYGALDPWHTMGLNEQQGAVIIPKTSHCQDFEILSETDSVEMAHAKEKLLEEVRMWLI